MNAGHVYVIAFDNGIVKVGRTQDVANRMGRHRGDGRKFGITLTESWSSPLHVEWEMNEETLKRLAAKYGGTPTCAEYFQGADYAAVVDAATRLPFTHPFAITKRRPMKCLKGMEGARQCVARVGALDARARETADETADWDGFRFFSTCKRCA